MSRVYFVCHDSVSHLTAKTKLTVTKNSRDQIDRSQNVRTKLTMTPKYRDQNDVSAYKLLV